MNYQVSVCQGLVPLAICVDNTQKRDEERVSSSLLSCALAAVACLQSNREEPCVFPKKICLCRLPTAFFGTMLVTALSAAANAGQLALLKEWNSASDGRTLVRESSVFKLASCRAAPEGILQGTNWSLACSTHFYLAILLSTTTSTNTTTTS